MIFITFESKISPILKHSNNKHNTDSLLARFLSYLNIFFVTFLSERSQKSQNEM